MKQYLAGVVFLFGAVVAFAAESTTDGELKLYSYRCNASIYHKGVGTNLGAGFDFVQKADASDQVRVKAGDFYVAVQSTTAWENRHGLNIGIDKINHPEKWQHSSVTVYEPLPQIIQRLSLSEDDHIRVECIRKK